MTIYISSNNLSQGSVAPNGTVLKPLVLDGSTSARAAPSPTYLYKNGITADGIYWLKPGGLAANQFYIDFTFNPGKPMAMVIANRAGSNGFPSLTYANATGAVVNTSGTYNANRDFNVWVGTSYWRYLGDTIIQGVKGYQAGYSAGTHNVSMGSMDQSAKWKFAGFTSTYAFKYARDYSTITGSYGTAGMYSYHAANEYSLTTYDQDQDVYSSNCSQSYGNNPWWYGACWDGNYFGGGNSGGHANAPYWNSSTSNYFAYGAIYIAWDYATVDN